MNRTLLMALATLPWLASLALSSRSGSLRVSPEASKEKGLAAWRKPGKIRSAACSNCHGPDGVELAIFDFSDETIRRRALPHVDPADAESIVQMIHGVRKDMGNPRLLDPMRDRPLQPMGKVLPGNTPEERDLAFGKQLQSRLPRFFKGPIASAAEARAAKRDMEMLDPWSLQFGIQLSRFSEDGFHGKEHASFAHWIPDVEIPFREDQKAEVERLADRYLREPVDSNFWPYYQKVESAIVDPVPTAVAAIAIEKYKSLLIFQHLARTGKLKPPTRFAPVAFGAMEGMTVPNPFWFVGDISREFVSADFAEIGAGDDLRRNKTGGPSLSKQMGDLRLSWLFLGWLMDQSLYRTTQHKVGRRGDWLHSALWDEGPYAIHNVYVATRRQLLVSSGQNVWKWPAERRHLDWDYSPMTAAGFAEHFEPKTPEHRELFRTFFGNAMRMNLFLLLEDLQTTHVVWNRDNTRDHIRKFISKLNEWEPAQKAANERLKLELLDAVNFSTQKT